MELLYYRDPAGNFGDDLNEILWRELLPAETWEQPDTVLLGVGSIFNAHRASLAHTEGKRVFVIGSGAGYGPLPPDWKRWEILAVRGPLTAELIGKPEAAATDGAALLARLPQLIRRSPDADLTLLVPHHHSASRGAWARVAEELGITYVDPRWPVEQVFALFGRARLVITEAMHGAIVADTIRVPWVPVVFAPDALPFKWRDWTLSLDLPYEPVRIAPSAAREAIYHRSLVRDGKRRGMPPAGMVRNLQDPEHFLRDFRDRYEGKGYRPHTAQTHPRRPSRLQFKVQRAATRMDSWFVRKAVRDLRPLLTGKCHLSTDAAFGRRLNQLEEAVARFRRLLGVEIHTLASTTNSVTNG